MSDIRSRQGPVFLDTHDESPKELPLMVTRQTLRSIGLAKALLEQLSAGATTDEELEASNLTSEVPSEQID